MGTEITKYKSVTKYSRITVGDKRVCPICIIYEDTPAMTMPEWQLSGKMPGDPGICLGTCRCGLVPSTIEELKIEGRRLIDEELKRDIIKADLSIGKQVLLKDYEKYEDILSVTYKEIAKMEALILQWKIDRLNQKIPKEFFDLAKIEDMIKWLEKSNENFERLLKTI